MLYSKGLLQYDLKIIEYCEEIIDIVTEQCEQTLQELKDNSLLKGSLNVTVGGANNEY